MSSAGGFGRAAILGALASGLALGVTLASNVMLGRILGASEYGIYTLALSVVILVSIPFHLGMSNLLVRQAAIYSDTGDWGALNGIDKASTWVTVGYALFLWLVFTATKAFFGTHVAYISVPVLLLVPVYSLSVSRASILRGLHRPILGILADQCVRPAALLVLALAWAGSGALADAELALLGHVIAGVMAIFVGVVAISRELPAAARKARPVFHAAVWVKLWIPFTVFAGLTLLNSYVGVIVLGATRQTAEVGVFKALTELSTLISFVLSAVNFVIAPQLAKLFHSRDLQGIQGLARNAAWAATAFAVPAVIALAFGGSDLLLLLYGPSFVASSLPLVILALGQLVNAAGGSVGLAANMSGNESLAAQAAAASVVVNFALAVLLCPRYGIIGASIASASALACWNGILLYGMWARSGINFSVVPVASHE